jgi:hypothetical protein
MSNFSSFCESGQVLLEIHLTLKTHIHPSFTTKTFFFF